ncbi:MAG: glycoside hydrolase family 26 protein [Acidimicrobiales bacterium]
MKFKKTLSSLLTFTLIALIALFAPSTASAATDSTLGVHRGSGAPDQVAEYQKWIGKPVSYTLDFVGRTPVGSANSWGKIDSPAWWCNQWKGSSAKLVLSTAMLPNTGFSLAEGAKGAYNSHWEKFGQSMVSNGCENIILRLGWEFNGKFYPWAAGGKEASFAAYWRQIVDTLRKVPGQAFLFDWCPLAGNGNANVEAAYPGDEYVDIIGLDAYDTSTVSVSDPAKRWNNQLNRKYGLNWQANFAKAHNKPMSFPEWGLTVRPNDKLGGGDNPNYIAKSWNWINTHNFMYAAYFEVDAKDASHRLMTSQFPKSSAKYRQLVSAG